MKEKKSEFTINQVDQEDFLEEVTLKLSPEEWKEADRWTKRRNDHYTHKNHNNGMIKEQRIPSKQKVKECFKKKGWMTRLNSAKRSNEMRTEEQ